MRKTLKTVSTSKEVAKRLRKETPAEHDARMAWWRHDRFGMFIHFGLYAMPARNEWVKTLDKERATSEESYKKYFRYFNPDQFDAREWARQAKAAGMKYAVLTAKHHEGFCLFDSKFTDYKITNTPFGRDLIREYVDAFRAEGIKVGIYYSLIDWHHPDFTIDIYHPLRPGNPDIFVDESCKPEDYAKLNVGRDMARYRKYMVDQITELLTNYGKIDIIWFDYSYPGEIGKGRDDWDSPTIFNLAHKLQPGIIIDNRLDLNDVPGGCDFVTPEQVKSEKRPELNGKICDWETCQTFSGSWGYFRDEASWKNPEQLIELLVNTVSKGGNLIMNVGPTARGRFDARATERLGEYAKWMDANSRSIYGCTQAPEEFKAPEGTLLTWNPKTKTLYIHLVFYPFGSLPVEFMDKIDYAQLLQDGSELKLTPKAIRLPMPKPNGVIPVIEVFLK